MTETTFDLNALTAGFKQAMQTLYGDRLLMVILYANLVIMTLATK